MDFKRVLCMLALIGAVSAFSYTKDDDPDSFKDSVEETTKRILPPTTTTTTTTRAPPVKPVIPKIQPTVKPVIPKIQPTVKPIAPHPKPTFKPFVPKIQPTVKPIAPKTKATYKPITPKKTTTTTTTRAPWRPQPTVKPWHPRPNPTNKNWRHPKPTKAPFKPVTQKKTTSTTTTTTTRAPTHAPWPRWSYQPSYPNGGGYGGSGGNGCSCNSQPFWNIGASNSNQSPIGIKIEPQNLRPHPDHATCGQTGWHQHAGDSRWHFHQPAVSVTSNTRPDSIPNSNSKNIQPDVNSKSPSSKRRYMNQSKNKRG
ncbi:hypothetical protein M3Y97_00677300 [Aphelenchoides bicaudatus]|nr:hypothetical protein M3Y97_00677300 [Aphelenchoides bicaudatus]